MTPQDQHLLLGVFRWAQEQGWRPTRGRQVVALARGWTDAPRDWRFAPEEGANAVVFGRPGLSVHRVGWAAPVTIPVAAVVEAVDVLVALRILPAVFSSAYRSGQSLGAYVDSRMPCVHDAARVGSTV